MKEAREKLMQAKKVVVLTGAGVSKESGLDTFRDKGEGLWSRYNPMELATPEAFARDPRLVWDWYNWRREKARSAAPNPAHKVIAALEERFPEFLLVTQNVDGIHQRAGSKKILCLHGNLFEVRCTRSAQVFSKELPFEKLPPYCKCGSMFRPQIVWFGEALPPGAMETAIRRVHDADLLMVVGTSLAVYPAAQLVPTALAGGKTVIEINPEPTSFSGSTLFLEGKAGEVLPQLVEGW